MSLSSIISLWFIVYYGEEQCWLLTLFFIAITHNRLSLLLYSSYHLGPVVVFDLIKPISYCFNDTSSWRRYLLIGSGDMFYHLRMKLDVVHIFLTWWKYSVTPVYPRFLKNPHPGTRSWLTASSCILDTQCRFVSCLDPYQLHMQVLFVSVIYPALVSCQPWLPTGTSKWNEVSIQRLNQAIPMKQHLLSRLVLVLIVCMSSGSLWQRWTRATLVMYGCATIANVDNVCTQATDKSSIPLLMCHWIFNQCQWQ